MSSEDLDAREKAIRAHCAQGNYELAMEAAWGEYRTEMLHFLLGVMRNQDGAEEVFSAFAEEVWRGLPAFQWKSSFRTWGYKLLRAACFQYMHSPKWREEPASRPLPEEQALSERTATHPWLKTEIKQGLAALRERLAPEDQVVLQLRINRKMSWSEIARIMEDGDEGLPEGEVRRRAAALRQQFHRVKEQLRTMAREAGLLGRDA